MIKNPRIMNTFNISDKERDNIRIKQYINYYSLKNLATYNFFELCSNELGITIRQAILIRHYLIYQSKNELNLLKELFPTIK